MSSHNSIIFLVLVIIFLSSSFCLGSIKGVISFVYYPTTLISVENFGAQASDDDSHEFTDNTEAFEQAWDMACSLGFSLLVPENQTYYLKQIKFSGPCQSNITFMIYGRVKAWSDMAEYKKKRREWIVFEGINDLTVDGNGSGIIDGNGEVWWQNSCKLNQSMPCMEGPTAVTFHKCKKLKVKNLSFKDAQQMHVSFEKCLDVEASNLNVTAPQDSPNTDGIHITQTVNIQVHQSQIGTGDDCISIVSGSRNVTATNITCGPGHGISIGSLGGYGAEGNVENVEVNGAIFKGTSNGARIKTWQGGCGYANDIKFVNIEMQNVSHPIIIDQSYCDQKEPCHDEESAVKVSNVLYSNITGTSASKVAITFECSKTVPCSGISLQNVVLDLEPQPNNTYQNSTAYCQNVIFGNTLSFSPNCSF